MWRAYHSGMPATYWPSSRIARRPKRPRRRARTIRSWWRPSVSAARRNHHRQAAKGRAEASSSSRSATSMREITSRRPPRWLETTAINTKTSASFSTRNISMPSRSAPWTTGTRLTSIAAMKAGCDVYCRKNRSRSPSTKARRWSRRPRKYEPCSRPAASSGSKPRYRLACELVRNGRIGKVPHRRRPASATDQRSVQGRPGSRSARLGLLEGKAHAGCTLRQGTLSL